MVRVELAATPRPLCTDKGYQVAVPLHLCLSGCRMMHAKRKPLTMRFDPDLLVAARRCAAQENRTLTNFIETVVRRQVEATSTSKPAAVTGDSAAVPASTVTEVDQG